VSLVNPKLHLNQDVQENYGREGGMDGRRGAVRIFLGNFLCDNLLGSTCRVCTESMLLMVGCGGGR